MSHPERGRNGDRTSAEERARSVGRYSSSGERVLSVGYAQGAPPSVQAAPQGGFPPGYALHLAQWPLMMTNNLGQAKPHVKKPPPLAEHQCGGQAGVGDRDDSSALRLTGVGRLTTFRETYQSATDTLQAPQQLQQQLQRQLESSPEQIAHTEALTHTAVDDFSSGDFYGRLTEGESNAHSSSFTESNGSGEPPPASLMGSAATINRRHASRITQLLVAGNLTGGKREGTLSHNCSTSGGTSSSSSSSSSPGGTGRGTRVGEDPASPPSISPIQRSTEIMAAIAEGTLLNEEGALGDGIGGTRDTIEGKGSQTEREEGQPARKRVRFDVDLPADGRGRCNRPGCGRHHSTVDLRPGVQTHHCGDLEQQLEVLRSELRQYRREQRTVNIIVMKCIAELNQRTDIFVDGEPQGRV